MNSTLVTILLLSTTKLKYTQLFHESQIVFDRKKFKSILIPSAMASEKIYEAYYTIQALIKLFSSDPRSSIWKSSHKKTQFTQNARPFTGFDQKSVQPICATQTERTLPKVLQFRLWIFCWGMYDSILMGMWWFADSIGCKRMDSVRCENSLKLQLWCLLW